MGIEERLAVLEDALKKERSKNRWWPLVCLTLVCVFGGVAATQSSDSLTVKSLTVASGKPGEAMVAISSDKGIRIVGPSGQVLLWLSTEKTGPMMTLLDAAGKARVTISADGRLEPLLGLRDSAQKTRLLLSADNKAPESSFVLLGPDGKVIYNAAP